MKVGDLVQHFLTEQFGIVVDIGFHNIQVMWTTQGLSLFGPGHKEWCDARSLEVINESR